MGLLVDDKNVEQSSVVKGFLSAGSAPSHEILIPYVVIRGMEPGPTLSVVAGIHPPEYASIEAVIRLINQVTTEQIKGTLFLIPVANVNGFEAREFINNPIDYVNQNRAFPGNSEGSMTYRVADKIFKEFILKSDYLVDYHGGDQEDDITGFIISGYSEDEELQEKMYAMGRCFETDFIMSTSTVGSSGIPLYRAASKAGVASVLSESGTPYPLREENIMFHVNGVLNVMKLIGMIDGAPYSGNPVIDPRAVRIRADKAGIWRQGVLSGERVKKGQVIGEIVDFFGEVVETVVAPFSGKVDWTRRPYCVHSGNSLAWVFEV